MRKMIFSLSVISIITLSSLPSFAYYRELVCRYHYKDANGMLIFQMQKSAELSGNEIFKWGELGRENGFSDERSELHAYYNPANRYFKITFDNLLTEDTAVSERYVPATEGIPENLLESDLSAAQDFNGTKITGIKIHCKYFVEGDWPLRETN